MQQGGARAGKSDDKQRTPDHLGRDFRMPPAVLLKAEAVAQDAGRVTSGRQASHQIQVRLPFAGAEQLPQRRAKIGVPKVVQTRPPLGGGHQFVRVQTDEAVHGRTDHAPAQVEECGQSRPGQVGQRHGIQISDRSFIGTPEVGAARHPGVNGFPEPGFQPAQQRRQTSANRVTNLATPGKPR